jgi:rhamnose utilization protein RhaD (predicted bifunctional aldolase and dehydrogenase)
MDLVETLIDLSHRLYGHPDRLVIYDEGLIAAKLERHIVLSRPGARLGRLELGDLIYVEPAPLLELLKVDQLKRQTEEETLIGCRIRSDLSIPGPEAYFVADLFDHSASRMLAHIQPILINQILASPRARQFADRRVTQTEVLGCGGATAMVGYADPGAALAKEIRHKVNLWRDRVRLEPKVVLLQNNGMVVMGDTPDELIETIDKILRAAEVFVGASILGGPQFLTVANIGRVLDYRKLAMPERGPSGFQNLAGELSST